jgi:hypothetical protein
MGLVNSIKSKIRNLTNVNAFANLADVNQAVASAAPYTFVGARLNHVIAQPPSISMTTAEACCNSDCTCAGTAGNCTCFTISNFAVGKYMITLSSPPANGFNVLIAPLSDARKNISVDIVSTTQVVVTTYDIVGAAYVDHVFKNTYIQFLLWN